MNILKKCFDVKKYRFIAISKKNYVVKTVADDDFNKSYYFLADSKKDVIKYMKNEYSVDLDEIYSIDEVLIEEI